MRFVISFIQKTLFVVLVVLFCGISSVFGQEAVIPPEVTQWQAAAAVFEKSGDFAGALAEYDKIIQAYPNTDYGLDACAQSAKLYVQQKQFENILPVVELICTNFSDQPGMFKVCRTLVEKCMYAGAYPVAESVCTQVQSRFSSSPRVVLMMGWRGMVYAHQGDFEGAEQMREALLQAEDYIVSDFLGAMGNIGWGYYCADNWDQALTTYRLGLERDSADPQAVYLQYQIVKACLAKGDIETADNDIQTLLINYGDWEITPGLTLRLGNEYYNKTQWQGAINVFDMLLTQYPSHELAPSFRGMEIKSYKMLAERHRRNKQPALAVAAYEAILQHFPDDEQIPDVRDAIVETYADAGDLAKAQEALQTDIEQCPHRRQLLRLITRVAVDTARAGDPNTALEFVDAIFSQEPEGADQLFGYTTLARVYVHQGKDAKAEATVNEALEVFKNDPNDLAYHLRGVGEEYYYRAMTEVQSGYPEQAKAGYEKSIGLLDKLLFVLPDMKQQKRSDMLYVTGLSYWQLGQWFPAAIAFLDTIEANPGHEFAGSMHWLVSDCYEKLKREGAVDPNEADLMIEWGYQTLFENYPDSRDVEYAAIRLIEINLARGKPVTTLVYINWFLDQTAFGDPRRMNVIHQLIAGMEVCGQ